MLKFVENSTLISQDKDNQKQGGVSFGFAVLVFAGVGATYVSPTASDDYVAVAVGCYEDFAGHGFPKVKEV